MKDGRLNRDDGKLRPRINLQEERMEARKEITEAPERHQWNQEPRLQEAAMAGKREDN
jgi:hypothetical protein